jgi:hypothetical protein
MSVTISSWASVSVPIHHAIGTLHSNSALATSQVIITARAGIRSTSTTVCVAYTAPISNGLAASDVAATSGTAIRLTYVPNWLAVCATQR